MAEFVTGMNVSLDGYVDHDRFMPDPELFRHFVVQIGALTGSVYGRKLYEIMRYWDDEDPSWGEKEKAFGAAWRSMPKWVVSRTLTSVGPNATLITGDLETALRELKAGHGGQIEVGGTVLAAWLGERGLIDQFQIYLHPVVLGDGTPFFRQARPRLKLIESKRIGELAIRLTYVPE